MKRVLAYCIATSLCFTSVNAVASHLVVYPPLNLPDYGSRLGVATDAQPYASNDISVFKVTTVLPVSGLFGVLVPGDFIYSVNGFNLRNVADMAAIISSGTPGQVVTVWFLDSRDGFKAKKIDVRTVSVAALETKAAPNASASNSSQTNSSSSKGFCTEHPIVCGAGLVIGALVIGSALSSSSSSSSSTLGQSGSSSDPGMYRQRNDSDMYRQRNNDNSVAPPAEQPRTYGLYGNCPLSGAGYGC